MALTGTLSVTVGDDAVEFELAVENDGEEAVEVTFRDGGKIDVVVSTDDEAVWRFRDGRMFTQVIQTDRIDPGEERTYGVAWETPRSGSYSATATLEATDTDLEASREFSV